MDINFDDFDKLPDYFFTITDNLYTTIHEGVSRSLLSRDSVSLKDRGIGIKFLNCVILLDSVRLKDNTVYITSNICKLRYDEHYTDFILHKYSSFTIPVSLGRFNMYTDADIIYHLIEEARKHIDFRFFTYFRVVGVTALVLDSPSNILGYRFDLCILSKSNGKPVVSIDINADLCSSLHISNVPSKELHLHGGTYLTSDEWVRKKEVWNVSDNADAVKYLLEAYRKSSL